MSKLEPETSQYVSWLRDKAGRAPELSWTRMMHAAADRLETLQAAMKKPMVHDCCQVLFEEGLEQFMLMIDDNGFELVCVIKMDEDVYRVFYRRPAP